jgi:hypothetical protein
MTFRRGGQASLLCGFAALRAKYFFYFLLSQRRKEIVVS